MKSSVRMASCGLGLLCLIALPVCSPESTRAALGDEFGMAVCDPARSETGCVSVSNQRSAMPAACSRNADCPRGSICPGGYDFCVTPCREDADCAPPTRCLLDRLEVDFCGCETVHCGGVSVAEPHVARSNAA